MSGAYLPLSTRAENYGPFPTLAYAYEQGVTAVVGENGAGKSFVVNAPAVALFGHTPDGVSLGDLLSNFGGADRMTVTHEFMAGGERYRVRRSWSSRAGGKQTLDLEHNWTLDGEEPWVPMTKESIRETQAWIEGLLGFTKETFLASALQLQNAPSFASRGTSRVERCELLMTGLGLGMYERYKTLAERDRKQAEAEAARLEVRLEQAAEELNHYNSISDELDRVDDYAGLAALCVEAQEKRLERLLDEQRQAEQRASERRAAEAELREAETARLRLREQAAAADIARDEIEAARETLARLATSEDLAEAERQHSEAMQAYARWSDECDRLMDANESLSTEMVCPTCERPFDNEAEVRERLEANRLALHALGSINEPANADLLRAREQVTERARLEERIAGWQQTIDVVEAPGFTQEALKADIAVSDARKKLAAYPYPKNELTLPETEVRLARERVAEQRQRLDEARVEKARLEAQLERLQQVEEQDQADRRALGLLTERLSILDKLETMYGRDGIPALVIESVAVPFLEQEATSILHRLGKAWTVEIHLGKETKKGDVRPALDVKVVTETGATQRFEQCSGGEQMRLDIALHVAFVRLWKQRNGSWSELFALDEPEGLDADGMAALVDVLDFLAEEFTVVQLVSHHSELRDSIGQVAEISRNGRGSSVGVEA